MRLPALLFGVGHYTVTVELPRGRRAVPARQRHLPRHRGRRVKDRPADRHRRRGGAVAAIRTSHIPSDLRRGGAQPVRGRRAVRRAAAAQRHLAAAEGRRRHPGERHLGAARHQRVARRDQPWAAGNPARQPQDRDRRSLHRLRRTGPRTVPARQRLHELGDRRAQEPGRADHADRQSAAGAGHPRPTRRCRSARGRHTWPPSPGSCRHNDARVARRARQRAPRPPTRRASSFDRLQPTLPILLANLVSVGKVAVTYQPTIEQMLVLLPQGVAECPGHGWCRIMNTKQAYQGSVLGLQPQPQPAAAMHHRLSAGPAARVPPSRTTPDRPAGDLYCRVPQDSPFNVRGARNYPVRDRARQTRARR